MALFWTAYPIAASAEIEGADLMTLRHFPMFPDLSPALWRGARIDPRGEFWLGAVANRMGTRWWPLPYTHPRVRSTACFHREKSLSRSEASISGMNRRSSAQ